MYVSVQRDVPAQASVSEGLARRKIAVWERVVPNRLEELIRGNILWHAPCECTEIEEEAKLPLAFSLGVANAPKVATCGRLSLPRRRILRVIAVGGVTPNLRIPRRARSRQSYVARRQIQFFCPDPPRGARRTTPARLACGGFFWVTEPRGDRSPRLNRPSRGPDQPSGDPAYRTCPATRRRRGRASPPWTPGWNRRTGALRPA